MDEDIFRRSEVHRADIVDTMNYAQEAARSVLLLTFA